MSEHLLTFWEWQQRLSPEAMKAHTRKELKRQYSRFYQKHYKRRRRRLNKELVIYFKRGEYVKVKLAAERSGLSVTQYIREMALCTRSEQSNVLDKEMFIELEKQCIQLINKLQRDDDLPKKYKPFLLDVWNRLETVLYSIRKLYYNND